MPGGDDGFGLPPGLDTGADSSWDDGFDLGEPTDLGGTPDAKSGEQPWWVRLAHPEQCRPPCPGRDMTGRRAAHMLISAQPV